MVITISMSMEIVSIDAGAGILIYLQSKKREIAGVFDVHIGNGRFFGDKDGDYTCITPKGCSVVDYILLSTELFQCVDDFSVVQDQLTNSVHLPITCVFKRRITDAMASEPLPGLQTWSNQPAAAAGNW